MHYGEKEIAIEAYTKATLYIIRGLPNSGKSAIASKLCPWWHPRRHAISADDYPARYLPDGSLNPAVTHRQAWRWARRKAFNWLRRGHTVAVSGVFADPAWFRRFVVIADRYGCPVQIIVAEALIRGGDNGHGVPPDKVASWRDRWQPFRPE